MSDTIVISNAERLILIQYNKSVIPTLKKQIQLQLALNKFVNEYDIDDDIKPNPLYRQYRLSIDTAIAIQLSDYDMFEARLRSIHRYDNGEFIGLDDLHKVYRTRVLRRGHTLLKTS
jgi:hypothetical protein